MSATRQAWNPWRAKAPRRRRGSLGACRADLVRARALIQAPFQASGRHAAADWRAPAASRVSRAGVRGRCRRRYDLQRLGPAQAPAPRDRRSSTCHRLHPDRGVFRPGWRPPRTPGSRSPGPATSVSQWSRVVARVNAAGTVNTRGAAQGEDPVELGEAQVETDDIPSGQRPRRALTTISSPGASRRGLG